MKIKINCTLPELKEYSCSNPMSHTNDVQFVLNEEKLFHKMTRASNEEELQLNEVIEKNKSDK